MRFVLHTNIVSPHQIPLAQAIIARVGTENFRYVYTEQLHDDRVSMGWSTNVPEWCMFADSEEAQDWLLRAEVLLTGLRDFDLLKRRSQTGLKSFYMSERWFKPIALLGFEISGHVRMLFPAYWKLACRFIDLINAHKYSCPVVYLPIGCHAARDMAWLTGILRGRMSYLFQVPRVEFERWPMGKVTSYPWMRMWGYFVAPSSRKFPSTGPIRQVSRGRPLRVLWVGRIIHLKHVETIIKAVVHLNTVRESGFSQLTIVGAGSEESKLKRLALELELKCSTPDAITFSPPVSIEKVREIMRLHDVYVFSSNAYEGWGAVVNEALEEGMTVLGSCESGAPSTILSESQLFHCWDWMTLADKLWQVATHSIKDMVLNIGEWNAASAAERLLSEPK